MEMICFNQFVFWYAYRTYGVFKLEYFLYPICKRFESNTRKNNSGKQKLCLLFSNECKKTLHKHTSRNEKF